MTPSGQPQSTNSCSQRASAGLRTWHLSAQSSIVQTSGTWHDRAVSELARQAAERLRLAHVTLRPGLSDVEISRAEESFAFTFSDEHRALLTNALPVGSGWV